MKPSIESFRPSRRQLLQSASCGFGYLALSGLCNSPIRAAETAVASEKVAIQPKAKRVIFLCMGGGPAQLDTFDYKPQNGKKPHPGSVFKFAQHGECGRWISELMPEITRHADKLCVINGMYADTSNHAQAFLQLHTGERLRQRPSMGSWVTYGLGSENDNLPGFLSFNTSKPAMYSSEFLPAEFQGTPIGVNGEDMSKATIVNARGDHLRLPEKRRQLDFIQALNRRHAEVHAHDSRLDSVIESMELGFRMQSVAPDLLDLSDESPATLQRYNVGHKEALKTCKPSDFGRQCLLARRFSEAGVRFIELHHSSWDQHKNHRAELIGNCKTTDAPIAALLDDLEDRGLLEETLVVWGGEFGRPGLTPGDKKDGTGHSHQGFTFWMAGGGVKAGHVHGATNEIGSRAVEGKVHFRDLHATILHLLGLDHNTLSFQHEGRLHRLTGPEGGKVVQGILA